MKIEWVKDLKEGQHIRDEFIVASVAKCASDKGKAYLNIKLQDKTGSIDAKKWDVSDRDLAIVVPGAVIEVEGDVNSYRDALHSSASTAPCATTSPPQEAR